MEGYKDKSVDSKKLKKLPSGIVDKKGKPFTFQKPLVFDKGDVTCEYWEQVDDPVYKQKGYNCTPNLPVSVPSIELPSTCRTNSDCPRGYKCNSNSTCLYDTVSTPVPIDDLIMWCNINGWVICGSDVEPDYGCAYNEDVNECVGDTGWDGYNCLWCEAYGVCYSRSSLYGDEDLLQECGGLFYNQSLTYKNELGCTDPYAINYNPYAYAQRNELGEGCPHNRDCCLYEGTKIKFQREPSTKMELQPGSYIIVMYNNNFEVGGMGGFAPFWEVFQSLASYKHAPEMLGGKFYITDGQANSLEEINEVRNGGFDTMGGSCDPSSIHIDTDYCTGNYWYHISVYEVMTLKTNYKYRIWKCGESTEDSE